MICERRMAVRVKVYKIVVKAAIMCGLVTVALTEREEEELEAAELKVLIGSDREDYECIRRTTQAQQFGGKVRQTRLRWFVL